MRKLTAIGLVFSLASIANWAEAQIVRVGPGGGVRVRAPFVDVQVAPGGSTRVRAPFTSVVTPGYGGYISGYERPTARGSRQLRPLTESEFAQSAVTNPTEMNWRELRRHTRAVAERLEGDLRQVTDGATWTASLRPGTIRDLLAEDVNQPPDPATAEQLRAILQSYDAVAESGGYPHIADLDDFRQLREALVELTSPPEERTRRRLASQWNVLHRELDQFGTGGSWQSYLEIPQELLDRRLSGQEPKAVEEMLARYEEVARSADYRAITELGSFQETRRLLADYAAHTQEKLSTSISEPQTETIPPPQPLP